jgi:DNA-directed RNA polymerase subunit N (RpoN/RPB10)
MPLQQHQKRYYELVDKYTTEKNTYLMKPTTEVLINELKVKFSSINSIKSFEENVISYSKEDTGNIRVRELAEKYRYTPEFRALEEIGIPTKRYCCRRMFLCHPRDLGTVIM